MSTRAITFSLWAGRPRRERWSSRRSKNWNQKNRVRMRRYGIKHSSDFSATSGYGGWA